MSEAELQLQQLRESVRKRPGMYFGGTGGGNIPQMLRQLLDLYATPEDYSGEVQVAVSAGLVFIHFTNLGSSQFAPVRLDDWLNTSMSREGFNVSVVASACDLFTLESGDGTQL